MKRLSYPFAEREVRALKAGDAVCIVEAMKLFNPIKASASGKITFLVEHGKPVLKGQPIASIA